MENIYIYIVRHLNWGGGGGAQKYAAFRYGSQDPVHSAYSTRWGMAK